MRVFVNETILVIFKHCDSCQKRKFPSGQKGHVVSFELRTRKKGLGLLHRTEKVHQNMGQSRRLTQSSDFFICVRTEVSFSFYSLEILLVPKEN